ncbi:hypothetical protein M422DRAFT_275048, partial [Sphaerobolus stellatus SS14]
PVDRELEAEDFILFDGGGKLHGYTSDITRTFALSVTKLSSEQVKIWKIVHKAQEEALSAAKSGAVTQIVDMVARRIISDAGYGKYFTHRLGHGIGLEGHEAPYLRGGSNDIIQAGHTFSDEPGIYIPGKLGVRLEDCFVVTEDGNAVYLTERVGGAAKSPWHL